MNTFSLINGKNPCLIWVLCYDLIRYFPDRLTRQYFQKKLLIFFGGIVKKLQKPIQACIGGFQ